LVRGFCSLGLLSSICVALLLLLPSVLQGVSGDQDETLLGSASFHAGDPRSVTTPVAQAVLSDPIAGQFEIPRGAWQRIIGDVPSPTISNDPNRGIVLGGFGAGAFMYNISGSFGPWADEVGEYSGDCLKQAAFHIYEKNGEDTLVRCLATDPELLSAWEKLEVGDGTYYALHPRGWCVYDCFAGDIQTRFFSPIIAHNYQETSYPVAVWQFALSNPTADTAEISIMLTWPNPPFNGGRRTRTGFFNTPVVDAGHVGIVLSANHPANTHETQNSEWCIAVRRDDEANISYATWDPTGDGSDIWEQFSDDGVLSNMINSFDSAAALAVKIILPPGADKVVPVALAWDYPVVEFAGSLEGGHSTQWWKKYCEYFDTLGDNSFEIAVQALNNCGTWNNQIEDWVKPYTSDPRYPDWLICAAFNELYYNQFGGSFWESGLRSGHPEEFLGLHPEDHKNFIMESQVYTLSGNVSVGHYSSVVYARLWPEMERDLLRCHADIIHYYDECGQTALYQTAPEIGAPRDFLAGDPCTIGDPFFVIDPHGYQARAEPCAPGTTHLQTETSAKFVQRCWRYYALYEDLEFLEYIWPAAKSTYQFMKSYDCGAPPRDSLPNAQGYDNTYDGWAMYGTDIYSGGFWVGGLEALDTMAAILDKPIRSEIQAWLEAAKRNLDDQLWDDTEYYYHIDTESEYPQAVFADALCGQRFCEMYGLSDILPRWKMDSHLQKVFDICVSPNPNFGARLGRMPDGSKVPTNDRDTYEYWVGTTYYVAAMMYRAGMKDEALVTAYGAYYPVYEDDFLAYWFNTPEAWQDYGMTPRPNVYSAMKSGEQQMPQAPGEVPVGDEASAWPLPTPHQYQRPRAVWELIFTMQEAAPAVPNQQWPEDLAYLNDSTPVFRWSSTLGMEGSYTLQYARDDDFTINLVTINEIVDTVYATPDSAPIANGVWFWRVEAIDQNGTPSGYQDSPYSFAIDTGAPCNCAYLGDCDGNYQINPVDLVYMINHVYLNKVPLPPEIPNCPAVNGDWNCDDQVNPVDIVFMVRYVYIPPSVGPCDPCDNK